MQVWPSSRSPKTLPSEPVEYPIGSFLKTEKGYFYIVADNKRYRITTKRCLNSWSPQRVVVTTEAALAGYRIAAKLKFRNGSLIHGFFDGRLYLIEGGKRRHIVSPDAFDRIGGRLQDVVAVSLDEINLHPEGAPLA